ncbi:MAG: isoprenyl transferase [Bacteroidetes bacterium]|jgi:undecaprenyl diphosphate synthase|nr:isoprenyl transferase [Bacteroidota bacterium]MBK8328472.1 isoprenyl transferase [Bacteroidota bacterium]MBK9300417.1 isoprenyl transferase [Bacteroidota bacterium]MBK9483426.1 isoprenyl transferase [Bacteroidota bacterium]
MLDLIDKQKLPKHVAIIMDGNGRWAKERGKDRLFGHQHGVLSVRDVVEGSAEIGIQYLTLYAFSTENWNRPVSEVNGLMELLVSTIKKEAETLKKNGVRLYVIGDMESLPDYCVQELHEAMEITAGNDRLNLILALSYSSKWEITHATKKIAQKVKDNVLDIADINEEVFKQHLATAPFPDPELMIRTSGEHRISNFLLYQLAYAELYFTHTHWPDFRKENFFEAVLNYQNRERRFGKISEQLNQA